jgi:hypothetical protein
VITADALLTQRDLARYLVKKRKAHYHFIVKGNQPTLLADIETYFQHRKEPDYIDNAPPDHGRIETRKIWTTTELNDYLNFPQRLRALLRPRACSIACWYARKDGDWLKNMAKAPMAASLIE